ncbi:MAG: GNAT family N-acetyltransferase [Pseudomonadota bacterium]
MNIRPAVVEDAAAICAVINPLIERGGTTANETPWTESQVRDMLAGFGPRDFMHVAEDADGVLGFQYVEAHPDLDEDTGDIASFAAIDAAGRGVGKAMAAATFAEAKRRGWTRLFAYIRADNTGGLAYYQSIGFRTIRVDEAQPLKSGAVVDRVAKVRAL